MIRYDVAMPARRKVDAQGNEVVIERRRNGALSAADNQKVVKQQTELNFKLIGKFGAQVADQGIQSLGWTNEDQTLLSYVRGTDNIVQVFDTKSESVIK